MKLVVFCLFAVCCCSLAVSSTNRDEKILRRKLLEVLKQLNAVKESLQDSKQMLRTPPQNIEDCCHLSALQCFRANLQLHFNVTEIGNLRTLHRSLKNPITERGLNFCDSRNVNSTCQNCTSHPTQNAAEFFNRLESLIQKGVNRLSMN